MSNNEPPAYSEGALWRCGVNKQKFTFSKIHSVFSLNKYVDLISFLKKQIFKSCIVYIYV